MTSDLWRVHIKINERILLKIKLLKSITSRWTKRTVSSRPRQFNICLQWSSQFNFFLLLFLHTLCCDNCREDIYHYILFYVQFAARTRTLWGGACITCSSCATTAARAGCATSTSCHSWAETLSRTSFCNSRPR